MCMAFLCAVCALCGSNSYVQSNSPSRELLALGLDLVGALEHLLDVLLALAALVREEPEGIEPPGPEHPEADARHLEPLLHALYEAVHEVEPQRKLHFIHPPALGDVAPEDHGEAARRIHLGREPEAG